MHGGLAELDRICGERGNGQWLVTEGITRAEIVLTSAFTFLTESVGLTTESAPYPALRALGARCEALPEFRSTRVAWAAPRA
jgi:glutathione S-transferase